MRATCSPCVLSWSLWLGGRDGTTTAHKVRNKNPPLSHACQRLFRLIRTPMLEVPPSHLSHRLSLFLPLFLSFSTPFMMCSVLRQIKCGETRIVWPRLIACSSQLRLCILELQVPRSLLTNLRFSNCRNYFQAHLTSN